MDEIPLSEFESNEMFCEAENAPAPEIEGSVQMSSGFTIEATVKQFLLSLVAKDPTISPMLLTRRTAANAHLRDQGHFRSGQVLVLSHGTLKREFDSERGSQGFLRVWKVLEVCYDLLQQGKRATQREVFYKLLSDSPHLFEDQRQVNTAIQDVVALLHCSRHSLGIIATSKGAIAGRLLIQPALDCVATLYQEASELSVEMGMEPNGDVIDCTRLGSNQRVISGDISYLEELKYQSDARYILVVEKDTIFHRLAEDRFFMAVPTILITGRGYPDLATRVVLRHLHDLFPSLPILALVDWNPAGLAIVCTYKFGSISMGLESCSHACDVKWLGLRFEDLQHVPARSFLNLKERDKSVAKGLLASKMLQIHGNYRYELTKMLECGKRVELEALYSQGYSFLSRVISLKIVQGDYI